jgi:hypothetical protein
LHADHHQQYPELTPCTNDDLIFSHVNLQDVKKNPSHKAKFASRMHDVPQMQKFAAKK